MCNLNVQHGKSSTSKTKRQEIQNWMTESNIPITENMFKTELYEVIKIHKTEAKKFVLDLDQSLSEHVYDCQLITKIWIVLRKYAMVSNTA